MRLVLMEFMSLDGVTQGPGAPDEDRRDGFTRGGWFVPHLDETFVEANRRWVGQADAFLFGRHTYESFARDWPNMPDPDDPVASRLNGLPKYVATTTLTEASWAPTTILSGDVEAAVAGLKATDGRELQIHGSTTLARSLLRAGLIDELRLTVAPVIVGAGRRLFEATADAIGLELVDVASTPLGLVVQTYVTTGAAAVDVYDPTRHTFRT
ncbi:MAG TPA: dihydrofolate reductase family protein [Acidimicrobiales bacterium]|nr:dihydrofolate reductase family protein [Acidimicrobiales bacterium]